MASTSCFLHHHALTTLANRSYSSSQRQLRSNGKPTQLVCRAHNKENDSVLKENDVSRRLALVVLLGGAVIASRVGPANAAYGEAGNSA